MKRLGKYLSLILASVVLICFLTIAAVILFIDPNQFKPLMISQLNTLTGFDIKIPGKLSWTVLPHLGMEVDEMEVNKAAQFNASLHHLVLRVKLRPLFHKQLEFTKASLGELHFNQLEAKELHAKVSFKDQILGLQPLTADVYQGKLHSEVNVSLKSNAPIFHVNSAISNVNMAALIQGLSGKTPSKLVIEGKANVNADLNMQGKSVAELLNQMNGTGRLRIDQGVMKGIDIGYYVDTAIALLNKEPLPTRAPTNQTDFGQLTGTAVIKNGVLYNEDLLLESPLYTTQGKGSINLTTKTLDYHLEVRLKNVQSQHKIVALAGKPIPIRVTGALNSPTVNLDTFALMQVVGKEQLKKVEEQIHKALPEKANKFLDNLFH